MMQPQIGIKAHSGSKGYVKATIHLMQVVVNLKEIEKKAKKEL